MKYDIQLSGVAQLLPKTQSVLVALSAQSSIDELAAGLALLLSLKQAGKEASIVSEGIIRVGHTNLFGVGEIQTKIPEVKGGNFVIALGGVAAVGPDGKGIVPALEKLDYYTSGSDLNLVFNVLPGQKFEPTSVTPRYEGGGFGLIFVIGAGSLSELGSVYTTNQQLFTSSHVVNIDNGQGNAQFGNTNVVDPSASSSSEMVPQILSFLGLPVNGDIATNILSGIFAATSGLQERNAGADTYEVVAQALRAGGQRPTQIQENSVTTPGVAVQPIQPAQPFQQPVAPQGFDLSKVFGAPLSSPADNFTVPPVVGSNQVELQPEPQPSPEEAVVGEEVVTPEDDWLTPKIFKGKGSIG